MKITNEKTLPVAIMAVIMLAGLYVYSSYSLAADMALAAAFFILYYMYSGKSQSDNKPAYYFMAATAAFFLLARFYKVFSYPVDFIGDEWTGLMEAQLRLSGDRGFFDYSKRFEGSLPYVSLAVNMLFLAVFKAGFDALRIVPPLLSLVTAAALYVTGREIKDKNLGLVFVFCYALSGYGFFPARTPVEHSYLIAFVSLFMALFFKAVKSGKKAYLTGAAAVLFFGFYTGMAFMFVMPFVLLLLFEYRKELGMKKSIMFCVFVFVALGVFLYLCAVKGCFAEWGGQFTGLRLDFIIKFFTAPLSSVSFTPGEPLFTAAEYILSIGAVLLCLLNIKKRESRIFLLGFIFSLFTFLFSAGMDAPLKHSIVLPFFVILSGFMLYAIIQAGLSVPVLAVQTVAAALIVFSYFTAWGAAAGATPVYRQMAQYINSKPGDKVFINASLPYGTPGTALRVKNSGSPGNVYLLTTAFWRKEMEKHFSPEVKYFYYYDSSGRPPLCVHEISAKGREKYFEELEKTLFKINTLMWKKDFQAAAALAGQSVKMNSSAPETVLTNSLMRYLQLECYGSSGDKGAVAQILEDKNIKIFQTADNAFYLGALYLDAGDVPKAVKLFKIAQKTAPEWDKPGKMLSLIEK